LLLNNLRAFVGMLYYVDDSFAWVSERAGSHSQPPDAAVQEAFGLAHPIETTKEELST